MATLSNNHNQENRKHLSWPRAAFPLFDPGHASLDPRRQLE